MSIWQVTKQAGEAAERDGEAVRQSAFEDGEIPEGRYDAKVVMLEADGVMVNQQKSRDKRAEVGLLTGYDGKQAVSKDRHFYFAAGRGDRSTAAAVARVILPAVVVILAGYFGRTTAATWVRGVLP
jgi:hypothetical protein